MKQKENQQLFSICIITKKMGFSVDCIILIYKTFPLRQKEMISHSTLRTPLSSLENISKSIVVGYV